MTNSFSSFNDIAELRPRLNHLGSLLNVIRQREKYSKSLGDNQKMNALVGYVVDGCIHLKSNGKINIRTGLSYIADCPKIMESQEFFNKYPSAKSESWTCDAIDLLPSDQEQCYHCGLGWDLENIFDFLILHNGNHAHKSCSAKSVDAEVRRNFKNILTVCGYGDMMCVDTSNEYDHFNGRGKWMHAWNYKNRLTMGWRKRVIEIRFHMMDQEPPIGLQNDTGQCFWFSDSYVVTHCSSYAHATSTLNYLKACFERS